MSSNFRPTNMYGSYGNRIPQGKINPTKGTGINSYQSGNTAKNVRGFWNKDYTNNTPSSFGKARPIKHYRKGRVIAQYIEIPNPSNESETITINYNELREVKSSVLNNMVSQMLWLPGSYSIVPNTLREINETTKSIQDCRNCNATSVVSSYMPLTTLTETPETVVENKVLCCNEERKAKRRVLPASTLTQKNYYQTNKQYMQNRCQTFKQRQFNFVRGDEQLTNETVRQIISTVVSNPNTIESLISNAKAGSPLSYFNQYVGQCYCNGAISETTLIVVISELILGLFNNALINQSEYDLLISYQFTSIKTFVYFINNTFETSRKSALNDYIYYTISSNKTLSELIEGPTNPSGCSKVYYKPSNYQFAMEGAVMSSTRNLKLNVDTINKNIAINKKRVGIQDATNLVNPSGEITVPYYLKAKYGPSCNKSDCTFD